MDYSKLRKLREDLIDGKPLDWHDTFEACGGEGSKVIGDGIHYWPHSHMIAASKGHLPEMLWLFQRYLPTIVWSLTHVRSEGKSIYRADASLGLMAKGVSECPVKALLIMFLNCMEIELIRAIGNAMPNSREEDGV